jgi:hypothetical protein
LEAALACDELRDHGIKCDSFEPPTRSASYGRMRRTDPGIQVVVAPEDVERAQEILTEWRRRTA